MSQPTGIKTIGYTNDGLVFFQVVTVYNDQPLETTIQFEPDHATEFCKSMMTAVGKAREMKGVSN